MADHFHPLYDQESLYVNFTVSGVLTAIGAHEHGMDHTHGVTLLDHTHPVDLPDHRHDLEYGIHESGMPATLRVALDGAVIVALDDRMFVSDFDLLPFISKDSNGRVQEGWHSLSVRSATDGSTGSIRGTLFSQRFLSTEAV